MSKPNFENIDRWFFEYTEGNLSVAQETELLDFLNIHPELNHELNAWKKSKISTPENQPLDKNQLTRAVPLFLRPISLISITALAFILGYLGIQSLPTSPLYTKANIDAEIISIEENENDLLFGEFIAQKESLLPKNNESPLDKSPEERLKTTPIETNNSTDLTSNKRNRVAKHPSRHLTTEKLSKENKNKDLNSEKDAKELSINTKIQNKKSEIQANDLAIISDYLNEKDKTTSVPTSSENNQLRAHNSSKTIRSSSSKSSFKRTLTSTFRKIKRMAEYPVALQNTKKPHYHTPMMTGYKANYAMVGTAPGNRFQMTSRVQWLKESNSQLMNSISYDGYVYALRGGIGIDVNYNNYQNNGLNNYSAALTYSPKFSINKKISFEPAIRFKMGVINLDQQADIIGDKIEIDRNNIIPLFTENHQATGSQLWYRDISLGFMLNTEWFYLGFNADNIGRHENNFYSSDLNKELRSDVYYTAILGTEYKSKTQDTRISGYGLYQNHGDLNELWLGTNFQYKWMQVGAAASSNLDYAASLGTVFESFHVHYNIDYTKSQLLQQQFLSHQLSLKILLKPSRYAAKFLKL